MSLQFVGRRTMLTQKSILTISRNALLQNLRTSILERAGYHVAAATSDDAAIRFVKASNSFSLVLLCHCSTGGEPHLSCHSDKRTQSTPADSHALQRV